MVDLTAAESSHIAGALCRALAGRHLTVTVLHCGEVGVGSWALRPVRNQSVVLTVDHRGDVCRGARHWWEEMKKMWCNQS